MFTLPPVYNAGDTVFCYFDTYGADGASIVASGLAVTDIEVYKNGSTTQRASDNGYTLLDTDGLSFDGADGLNGFSIDTSDNSDSGFWTDGAHYLIHVNAVTVDSQTVRFSFELTLGYLLRPTTAGRKLDVSSGGEGGIDWANIGSPTTTVGLSGTTVKTATDVETDTADIQSRLPAALGANGNMKADVRDYNGTAGTFSGGRPEVNTTHAGGTAWNSGAIGANTLASDTITAAKIATDAITAAKIAADAIGSSELAASAVTEIKDAIFAEDVAGADYTAGTFGEYAQSIAPPSAIADAVYDEATSGHNNIGTFGELLGLVLTRTGGIDDLPTNAELATALAAADDAVLAAIAALNNLSSAQAQAAAAAALTAYDPPTRAEATSDVNSVLARLPVAPYIAGSVDDAGATTTSFIGAAGLSATNDFYNGAVLAFTSGALQGLSRRITDYVGSTRTFTFGVALPAAPANGVTFVILGYIEEAA